MALVQRPKPPVAPPKWGAIDGNLLEQKDLYALILRIVSENAGGSASITATSVTIPYATRSTVTVTDATVTATSKILIGWGDSSDTDANDCEMDDVTFKTKSGTASFDLTIASARGKIGGVFKLNYQVAA